MKSSAWFLLPLLFFTILQFATGRLGEKITLYAFFLVFQLILIYGNGLGRARLGFEMLIFVLSCFLCMYLSFSLHVVSFFDAILAFVLIFIVDFSVFIKNNRVSPVSKSRGFNLRRVAVYSLVGAPFLGVLLWSVAAYYSGVENAEEAVYFSVLLYGVVFIIIRRRFQLLSQT